MTDGTEAGDREQVGHEAGDVPPAPDGEAPPPPRTASKRSGRARNPVVVAANFVMSVLLLAVLAGAGAFYLGDRMFTEAGPLPESTTYLVQKGASVGEIGSGLAKKGIISDARLFSIAKRIYMPHRSLKAGEYRIDAHASMRSVMELLQSGRSILYSLTFPEGLTVKEMFALLARDPVLSGPMPENLPPEGSLMPDTYSFTRGTSRQEIIDKMKAADSRAVDRIWQNRDQGLAIGTKEEMVVLASIVEKETGKPDERPRVAAVFMNRLRKGMRLQSDPTVIYGLFGGDGKPSGRPLYQSDLDRKTPYNTYEISGLPPAPICNPGRASLEAVARPATTKDLYFVADGTGGHVFSTNLKEHNANVRRWREIEAARRSDAGQTQDTSATKGGN